MRRFLVLLLAWLLSGVGIGASYYAGKAKKRNRLV
jgi:hypothetical protein